MLRNWLAAHKSLVATAMSGTVIAALIATVAVVSGGYPAQLMQLNDASVWVVNQEQQVIGRANTEVLELNSVVAGEGTDLDVVQGGANVLLFDRGNSKVDVVDPTTSTVSDSVPMPPARPDLFLAGENAVITESDGEVWILPAQELPQFDTSTPPVLSLGGDTVFNMRGDGTLFAFSAEAGIAYAIDAARTSSVTSSRPIEWQEGTSEFSVTGIGEHLVVLEHDSRTIAIDGRKLDLSDWINAGDRPRLQSAAIDDGRVLIAYAGGLLAVPITGGDPEVLVADRTGTAAVPVVVDGCAFAAWSDGSAWRHCVGTDATILPLAGMPPGAARISFSQNGDRVVLNDARGGGSWAVQQRGQLIDNWDELVTFNEDEQEVVDNNLDTPPEYEKTQEPPVAVDDAFGARPGKSTVLPLLLNDYDPNGDVLVVSQLTSIEENVGRLDLINNNQQVQLTLNPNASGTLSFDYTITDGRGGEDSATVTVTVRAPGENSPPQQVRRTTALVAEGGSVKAAVLGDWIDPDGDAFYLASATTHAPDTATHRPDGTVVFIEGGAASRARTVALVVTDGTEEGAGTLDITVRPPGEVPIITEPFVVLAYAGQEVRIKPLEHVRGGTGTVRLTSVPEKTGATITPNLEAGTFRFVSDQVRTFLLEYVVSDQDQTATGQIRVDVAAPPGANTRPITVPKTVFVKTLSSATVDVAGSDIDPAGGVLLVTGVHNVPAGSGVKAEIMDQRDIRVTLTAPLDTGPVVFNYRVSNGLAEAEGVVTVVEIPRPARLQPPIAVDDSISVRVGAAIDIPVLDNDSHPDGEELTLSPDLSSTPTAASGLLFASGNRLRYLAPAEPGNFTAGYEVAGPDGQVAQATVSITVREAVEATNNAPFPVRVTARVIAGESVRIRIPLAGIDPDGDAVQLLGQQTNPQKGAVLSVDAESFQYQAGEYSAGTDTFTYTVIDALGARATGTVRVGISPRQEGARNPVAVADEVSMRPGGSVTVRVLDNDSDPDGSPLTVLGVQASDQAVLAETDGEVVRVTPPRDEGIYGLIYTIQNERGGTSANFLTVTVDADAPFAYPIASDTVLTLTDILDRDSVDVNVLANVFFADGPSSDLGLTLLPGYDTAATVTNDKRVRITVQDARQIIPFAVSHPDDESIVSYAFVWVPGYNDALPQVNRKARPLTVASESTLTIPLNDYVVAIGGKQVRLADTTTVQATHSDGSALVLDESTLVFTSADKYFGPASISFEVTDGASADDPDGRRATLVLPIKVTPRENQPPVFNGAVIDFEPDEEKVLDLLKLTTYPYPDDLDELAFTAMTPLPVGFSYTLTGQTLAIRADEDAEKGSTTRLVLGVRDGLAEGKAGTIRLNVVASSRPLASPAADVAVAPRGKTTVVDVLANDQATNPFPASALSVVDIRGIDGGALPPGIAIAPSADNSTLAVTVSEDARAQDINLQYQVMDATRDPQRMVWGSVKIQVQDAPDPVTGVQVTGFGDKRLTVAWSPGPSNNSPIIGYEVTATSSITGEVVGLTTCAVTSGCDIPTPGNGPGNSVRISVVAINSIGRSEAAGIGSGHWSDIIPAAVTGVSAVPTATAPSGGSLNITWAPVPDPSPGSALLGYTVRITGPGVDIVRTAGPEATSLAVANSAGQLHAGLQYSVTVFARNSAQVAGESDWRRSAVATVTAVGPPSQASGGVQGAVVNPQGHIRLTWGASDPNGATGVTYRVARFASAADVPATCSPSSEGFAERSWLDDTAKRGGTYWYAVFASNGLYCTPTATSEIRNVPSKATGSIGLQANGGQLDIRVASGLTAQNASRFEYEINGNGAWRPVVAGQWLTSSADSSVYGNTISVRFRGCLAADGAPCGEASDAVVAMPLNARATIVSCSVDVEAPAESAVVVHVNPPGNAGDVSVGYLWSYSDGDAWSGYVAGATNTPSPFGHETVGVRVKAEVTAADGSTYRDHEYAESECTP